MADSAVENVVRTSSPENFPSWVPQRELVRHRRIVEWCDYVRSLNDAGEGAVQ